MSDGLCVCLSVQQGIRLWSRHNVDASVGVFASPGCPFVVCVGLFHVTTLQMEVRALSLLAARLCVCVCVFVSVL